MRCFLSLVRHYSHTVLRTEILATLLPITARKYMVKTTKDLVIDLSVD